MNNCVIKNLSNLKIDKEIHSLVNFAKNRLKFKRPPTIFLNHDKRNSQKVLAKTGYYDPETMEIHIYTTGRHPKDILRSVAHELVHHLQNEKGKLDNAGYSGKGYAQKNPHLRNMEREANDPMLFRDWEDSLKQKNPTIYNEWRSKCVPLKENQMKKEYNLEEDQDRIFAPNHYCAHHVIHEGKEGFTVDHNWSKKLGKVTRYDVKFLDGTVKRNIHESKLTILEAFTEEAHGKRDNHPPVKKEEDKEEIEELNLTKPHMRRDAAGGEYKDKAAPVRRKLNISKDKEKRDAYNKGKVDVEDPTMEEGAKPDFLDLDKDGDKKEPMKDAAEDAKDKKDNEEKKETTKEWKNRELNENLSKKWGFSMDLSKLKK